MKTKIAASLILAAGLLAAGNLSAALSSQQKLEVEKVVEEYLMAHPEVVIKAIHLWQQQQKRLEERMQKEAISELRKEVAADPRPAWGNPEGGTTVIEFSDYNCPYCKQSFPRLKQLVDEDGDIRVVMKELPVLGRGSVYAAKAALAAMKQGKYAAFHEALMNLDGRATPESVDQVARELGLDLARLKRDMQSSEVAEALERDRVWAERLGIDGTPAFIIGDRLLPGAVGLETMKRMVEAARGQPAR